jgi:hypothetical protein
VESLCPHSPLHLSHHRHRSGHQSQLEFIEW